MNFKFLINDLFWSIFAILLMMAIFIQSNFPSVVQENNFYQLPIDKFLHAFVWLVLGFSIRFAFNRYFVIDKKENFCLYLIIIIIFCVFYGFSDEVHQYFVPTRSADILDALADSIGSIIGTLIAHKLIFKSQD